LEKKTKQLDEQVLKADKEYFDSCKKLELARAEWDSSVYKVQFAAVVLFSISLWLHIDTKSGEGYYVENVKPRCGTCTACKEIVGEYLRLVCD